MRKPEYNTILFFFTSDYKPVYAALSAAVAAFSRLRPYVEFDPYSPVEVLQMNGKGLCLGETVPVAIRPRNKNAWTSHTKWTAERSNKFARVDGCNEPDEPEGLQRAQESRIDGQTPPLLVLSSSANALPVTWIIGRRKRLPPHADSCPGSTNLDNVVFVDIDKKTRDPPANPQVQNNIFPFGKVLLKQALLEQGEGCVILSLQVSKPTEKVTVPPTTWAIATSATEKVPASPVNIIRCSGEEIVVMQETDVTKQTLVPATDRSTMFCPFGSTTVATEGCLSESTTLGTVGTIISLSAQGIAP